MAVDQLRAETVQTIATIELLLAGWYEPPNAAGLHLSTLIQQVLSVIAQHGGASAPQLYSALCATGPFATISQSMFAQLLRDLGATDVVIQASDGTLLPGGVGERLVNHYSFYTAFQTSQDFRLVSEGRTLGSMPVDHPIMIDSLLFFAGRSWKVIDIDDQARVIELARSAGGRPPLFSGGGIQMADGVRARMREIYDGGQIPGYLDQTAQRLLGEGRASYRRLGLRSRAILSSGRGAIVFPWRGDRIMNTLSVVLAGQGLEVGHDGVALTLSRAPAAAVLEELRSLASAPLPTPASVAKGVVLKARKKHHIYLGEALLNETYAARDLDGPGD